MEGHRSKKARTGRGGAAPAAAELPNADEERAKLLVLQNDQQAFADAAGLTGQTTVQLAYIGTDPRVLHFLHYSTLDKASTPCDPAHVFDKDGDLREKTLFRLFQEFPREFCKLYNIERFATEKERTDFVLSKSIVIDFAGATHGTAKKAGWGNKTPHGELSKVPGWQKLKLEEAICLNRLGMALNGGKPLLQFHCSRMDVVGVWAPVLEDLPKHVRIAGVQHGTHLQQYSNQFNPGPRPRDAFAFELDVAFTVVNGTYFEDFKVDGGLVLQCWRELEKNPGVMSAEERRVFAKKGGELNWENMKPKQREERREALRDRMSEAWKNMDPKKQEERREALRDRMREVFNTVDPETGMSRAAELGREGGAVNWKNMDPKKQEERREALRDRMSEVDPETGLSRAAEFGREGGKKAGIREVWASNWAPFNLCMTVEHPATGEVTAVKLKTRDKKLAVFCPPAWRDDLGWKWAKLVDQSKVQPKLWSPVASAEGHLVLWYQRASLEAIEEFKADSANDGKTVYTRPEAKKLMNEAEGRTPVTFRASEAVECAVGVEVVGDD